MEEKIFWKPMLKDFASHFLVVGLCITLVATIFPTSYFLDEGIRNVYNLDMNPRFVFKTDKDDNVIVVRGLNPEAWRILNQIEYENRNLKNVVNDVVELAIAEKYVVEEQLNEILLVRIDHEKQEEIFRTPLSDWLRE